MMPVKDPCGICCLLVTYAAIVYADYVVIRWILLQSTFNGLWSVFHVVLFNVLIALMCICHLKAVLTDPGIVPIDLHSVGVVDILDHPPPQLTGCDFIDWTVCTKCEIYRPPRAHHCRICKRCIRRMDHHCPWINNCVGEQNQKFFIQFLFYVGLLCVYAIALIAFTWIAHCDECSAQQVTLKQTRMMHSVFLLLECVMFGLLVLIILIDQIQSIVTDRTAIEQLQQQGSYSIDKSKRALFRQVCGSQHPLLWLCPFSSGKRVGFIPHSPLVVTHEI